MKRFEKRCALVVGCLSAFLLSGVAAPARADLLHQWTFNGNFVDLVGNAHGTAFGGASILGDRLMLDGVDDFMRSAPIDNTITEKTLLAWVSLDNLTQQSGSALSLENPTGGDVFDGVVYGERLAGQWMNGSNAFSRSVENNGGVAETVTEPGEVMIAVTYDAANNITIYRDGAEYASATNTSLGALQNYPGGVADVLIGLRHVDAAAVTGTVDGNDAFLAGFVNEARVYNTALSLTEVQDVFSAGTETAANPPPPPPPPPDLLHQWTFNGDARDQVGSAHGALAGGATIVGDRLSVDGVAGSRMLTAPTGQAINAKTLVAWVSLNDVNNSSRGSALTLQNDAGGGVFDGIVYGEVNPQHWMAGSNGFVRTQNPQEFGFPETVGEPGEVMMAIVYDTDNSITLYRDGEEYGSYTKGSLQPFDAAALVQIGPRHGTNADVFDGFVNEARIYGGALSADDIMDVFTAGTSTTPNPPPPPPSLAHQWTFDDGTADDSIGTAHGTLFNGAAVVGGRLSLDAAASQYFRSAPVDESITEKTMVAWVSLADLDNPTSGSVLTLENPTGTDVFDGVVYAERTPRQWMNGSNFFSRSGAADNGGEAETVTEPGEVMIAITYDAAGDITIYRDGAVYAQYNGGPTVTFAGGVADVLIGPRHEDRIAAGGPAHFITGFVNEARIYQGALSNDQIQIVMNVGPGELPLPGDVDLDDKVNRADAALLVSRLGGSTLLGNVGGDFNLDASASLRDVAIQQANLGAMVVPSPTAVPEPSGVILLSLGLGAWASFGRVWSRGKNRK